MSSGQRRIATVVVAAAFLSGALGYAIGTADERVPSETDLGFAQDMILHHDQAVSLALMALDKSETSIIRSFAQEVVLFQRREIGLLESFLTRWGRVGKGPDDVVMGWMGMPMPVEEMPGYADPVELEALRGAAGPEFDMRFLTLLAAHHVGGIQMAAFAAENARDPELARLARIIARNQAIEISEYAATAARLGLAPLPGSPTLRDLAALAQVAQT